MATETVEQQEEEQEETTNSTEETETESTETEDSTEYVSKEEIKGLTSALQKERDNVKALKKELGEIKRQDESEAERAAREAAEKAEAKYKKALAETHARSLLVEAGVRENPERFLRMLDHTEVYVNDDGQVVGIKDQVNQIKRDFPEVFSKKAPSVDAGNKKPVDSDKGMSSAERIAAVFNNPED